jgi:hypothetical protein
MIIFESPVVIGAFGEQFLSLLFWSAMLVAGFFGFAIGMFGVCPRLMNELSWRRCSVDVLLDLSLLTDETYLLVPYQPLQVSSRSFKSRRLAR